MLLGVVDAGLGDGVDIGLEDAVGAGLVDAGLGDVLVLVLEL